MTKRREFSKLLKAEIMNRVTPDALENEAGKAA